MTTQLMNVSYHYLCLHRNIKRIVFNSLEKFDGYQLRALTSAHAKQIAGRAGRYGMEHNHGAVTTCVGHLCVV